MNIRDNDNTISTETQKVIIPLSPQYIIDKLRIQLYSISFEATWHQAIAGFFCIVLTTIIVGLMPGVLGIIFEVLGTILIWGLFFKYAFTQEKYLISKLKLLYWIRKKTNHTTYSAASSPISHIIPQLRPMDFILRMLSICPLYEFEIKDIKKGIIHYSYNRYGAIINCITKPIDAEDMPDQIIKISGLLKSIPDKTVVKFRVSSYIPHLNTVEAMTIEQIANAKNKTDKNLLYSLHDLSKTTQKAPQWMVNILIAVESDDKMVDYYFNTVLPGFLDRLHASKTIATVLTNPKEIYKTYIHEGTGKDTIKTRTPALFSDKTVWNEKIRQIMQGSTQEYPDHLVINHNEYIGCLRCGVPVGGVAGFPPTVSYEVLEQLYSLSASNDHVISIDTAVYPIPSNIVLTEIKKAISKLQKNEFALNESKTTVFDLGLDIEDLQQLYSQVKDRRENIFDTNVTITVFSPSYEKLISGLSKVSAILAVNSISNQIPTNEVLKTFKNTQFMPYYDDSKAIWMPTSALSRILPITQGATLSTSITGTYIGNEVGTNQEIVVDYEKLGAQHTLEIGSTRSGKTTDLNVTGIRTVLNGDNFIYISNKLDWNTKFLDVAKYFGDRSQVIKIGRQPDGKIESNINPFEIMYNDKVQFDPVTKFYEHIDFINLFINLITGGNRTDVQKGYIHDTILRLYAKFKFDPHNTKSWKPAVQPTLSDLYTMWETDLSADSDNSTIRAILIRSSGFKNTLSWLSNPTNVNMTSQYTVIDLSAVPRSASEASYYLMVHLLRQRFVPNSSVRETFAFDECGELLKNKQVQDELSTMLKQAASYRVRIILASQMLDDLNMISPELRANIYIFKAFGLNIEKNIDSVVSFAKFSPSVKDFLINCFKPGMAAVQIGFPFNTTYCLNTVLSELESRILFGKKEELNSYSFINPEIEKFANEHGVVFTDQVTGELSELKKNRTTFWQQRPMGMGKVYAYIKNELIQDGLIKNQSPEHYLSVCFIASWLIEHGITCQINHYSDADIVAQFPNGPVAFEWQTTGHNDTKTLMNKRETSENRYGRLFFIGSPDACREVRNALKDDKIVITRGKELETLLQSLINEEQT